MAVIVDMNASSLRKVSKGDAHGKSACACVGIDNLKGYYATQLEHYHVQYPAEAGASCAAWDSGSHPECRGGGGPQWCSQKWCYVDPCNCNMEELPGLTKAGITYQGSPAYWSYATCSSVDFWSAETPDACIVQKNEGDCSKNSKCAWNGKKCGGKEVVKTCKENLAKDTSVYGQDDCRCVGLGGRDPGKSFMYINDKDLVEYPANVGATCQAWEQNTHPDCAKADAPSWCSGKWCFVDPCKCKTKVPPKRVQKANQAMRFQGKTAYWSYEGCGSVDTWTSAHSDKYCVSQKSEAACSGVSNCVWSGKQCMGKALAELCEKQESSGILGVEAPLPSSAFGLKPLAAFLVVAIAAA